MPSFIKIVQAVKKLNSISRAQLNFRRRPILCTTLYRNLKQASNFGGPFDQLFLWIFLWNLTEDSSLLLLYYGAKKSKMTKNSNQGGSCLKGDSDPLIVARGLRDAYLHHLRRFLAQIFSIDSNHALLSLQKIWASSVSFWYAFFSKPTWPERPGNRSFLLHVLFKARDTRAEPIAYLHAQWPGRLPRPNF